MSPRVSDDEPRMVTKAEVAIAACVSERTVERDATDPKCPLYNALYVREGNRRSQATCTLEVQRRYIAWRVALPPIEGRGAIRNRATG